MLQDGYVLPNVYLTFPVPSPWVSHPPMPEGALYGDHGLHAAAAPFAPAKKGAADCGRVLNLFWREMYAWTPSTMIACFTLWRDIT